MPDPSESSSPPLQQGYARTLQIENRTLSYDFFSGDSPTIVFLPGFFFSRSQQAKANALEILAKRNKRAILVAEYLGVGKSEGDFTYEGTLTRWISDVVTLIDTVVQDRVLLVGAGVGGWIMLHVAMQRPRAVVGLLGINPSVDFTHDLIIPNLTEAQRTELESKDVATIHWGFRDYPISKALLKDAEQWLVLTGGVDSLPIHCPVRLLQGLNDEEIPASRILKLVDKIATEDCIVSFVKYGDHFLESEADFRRMWHYICEISDSYFEYDLTSPTSG